MENFYRKNDLGVTIEYTIIATYVDNGEKYYIYTDFVSADNQFGIRLFVDIETEGKLNRVSDEKEKEIIQKLNKDILNINKK